MPLSAPAARKQIHTRRVECRGYHREDGLWDIEGELHDSKTYPFNNGWRGEVQPGEPVHDMIVRLTVDDDMTIVAAEALTRASPFRICPQAADNFSRLVGLRIGPGWMRKVKERYGREQGCTHILEMLYPLGTTAFQTIFSYKARLRGEDDFGETSSDKPGPGLNSCWAYGTGREIVQRFWPQHYTGPAAD